MGASGNVNSKFDLRAAGRELLWLLSVIVPEYRIRTTHTPLSAVFCVGFCRVFFFNSSLRQDGCVGRGRGRAMRVRAGPRPFRRLQRTVRVLFRNLVKCMYMYCK